MAHNHSHGHGHTHTAHSHDHAGHSHAHTPPNFSLAFALASSLNFAFVIIEAIYAIMAHSMSLLADAGHNLGDVLGLLMAWWANWLLTKNASEKYSYGYKKMTILSSLTNALLLVATSSIIIYESIQKLITLTDVNETMVMVVAFIGIIVNGSTALLFLRGQDDLNIKGAYLHLMADALIAVGVVIAGAIIYFTHWLWLDPIVGILIVVVILVGTWSLLRNSIDLLLGAVPEGVNQAAVRSYLMSINGVEAIHDLHIWGLSTQEIALTAHLIMPHHSLTDEDFLHINHMLKHDFKIGHVTLQVEKGHTENPCGQVGVC